MNADEEIKRALEYKSRGDVITARNILGELVKADPRNVNAWVALSQVIGDPEKQMYCVNRAYELEPDNPNIQAMLKARQTMDKAQSNIESALRLRQVGSALGSISVTLIILGCSIPCLVIIVIAIFSQ